MPGHDHVLRGMYAFDTLKSRKQLLNWICPVTDDDVSIDHSIAK